MGTNRRKNDGTAKLTPQPTLSTVRFVSLVQTQVLQT